MTDRIESDLDSARNSCDVFYFQCATPHYFLWCFFCITLYFCLDCSFVFCSFCSLLLRLAHIGKLQAIILEVREAGWVGVEADPVDLTFQDLQVFDHIHCWFVSMSIIAISY